MGQSSLFPLGMGRGKVLVVLRLEPSDGGVEFQLILTLDAEDLILQLANESLEG